MEFENWTDQNFITQNLRHGKEHCIWKKKKLLKQCLKEVIYEYILDFAGWWFIFWEMVGTAGYSGGGVVVDIFWLVVGGGDDGGDGW